MRWAEWNGRFRDTVRDFWRGQARGVSDLAYRLTGSSDLYESDGRRPWASVNFVTAHDGFTLRDLVSYNDKHNEANGEDNQDGTDDNRSWNHGVEGETDDPEIIELRNRQRRNLLTFLLLSQGCPMLLSGDELGHTQGGNNNAYCQDNELTWLNWSDVDQDMLEFIGKVATLRRDHPIFRRRRFFDGRPVRRRGQATLPDIEWLTPDGREMTEEDWDSGFGRSIGVYLNGLGIDERDGRGQRVTDDSFLLYFNAHDDKIDFHLPAPEYSKAWQVEIDTHVGTEREGTVLQPGTVVTLAPRSTVVLRSVDG